MKTKLLAAIVFAAFAGAAYAADTASTSITNTQSVSVSTMTSDVTTYNSDTDVDINEVFDPRGGMGGLAEANISAVQKNLNNTLIIQDPSSATVTDSANHNAGNVGVNNASGFFNNQANHVAIAKADPSQMGGANAKVDSEQLNHDNTFNFDSFRDSISLSAPSGNNMTATVKGSVNDNDGNVGMNNAAGAANAQGNSLAIASASNDALAAAHSTSLQTNLGNSVTSYFALTTSATVDGSANRNAGNVGFNNAAGIANAQVNTLSMATADPGKGGTSK